MATPSSQAAILPAGSSAFPRRWRIVFSLLIFLHVVAVFVPPLRFLTTGLGTREGSPATAGLWSSLRPYCDFMFLSHGYAFFAPDPGPNHLLRSHLEYEDGRPATDLIFPDRRQQWPRLLYHRHFMLSEQLNNRYSPPTPPPADVGREVVERWRVERKVYDALWRSYENHLLAKYAAASVSMTRIEHRQPVPDEFSQQRIGLQDSRLYIDLPDRPTVGAAP